MFFCQNCQIFAYYKTGLENSKYLYCALHWQTEGLTELPSSSSMVVEFSPKCIIPKRFFLTVRYTADCPPWSPYLRWNPFWSSILIFMTYLFFFYGSSLDFSSKHQFLKVHVFKKATNNLRNLSRFLNVRGCLIIICSKSIWVTKLVFCQNDSRIGGSFWQKDSLITHILFELCLFLYPAQSK